MVWNSRFETTPAWGEEIKYSLVVELFAATAAATRLAKA